jgi:hypothetical protein
MSVPSLCTRDDPPPSPLCPANRTPISQPETGGDAGGRGVAHPTRAPRPSIYDASNRRLPGRSVPPANTYRQLRAVTDCVTTRGSCRGGGAYGDKTACSGSGGSMTTPVDPVGVRGRGAGVGDDSVSRALDEKVVAENLQSVDPGQREDRAGPGLDAGRAAHVLDPPVVAAALRAVVTTNRARSSRPMGRCWPERGGCSGARRQGEARSAGDGPEYDLGVLGGWDAELVELPEARVHGPAGRRPIAARDVGGHRQAMRVL